jgi:hypothetical protein
MDYHLIAWVAAGLIAITLIVVIAILNSKNNKLLLKADHSEYTTVLAVGELNRLILKFSDKDAECEQAIADLKACKQRRKYVKKTGKT